MKISLILGGTYIFISITLPILLLAYPKVVKHLVFLNICEKLISK